MSLSNYTKLSTVYEGHSNGVVVSKGIHTASRTFVAIKEQRHSSVNEANRSVAEAFNQASIAHEAIVPIYEFFLETQHSGVVLSVIVEEWMDGDLAMEINRRRVGGLYWCERELLEHLGSLSSACLSAQRKNIAHRDIKPQNIFLKQGKLKLGDFGSAGKHFDNFSAHRTLQGTPFYLSPELKSVYAQYSTGNLREVAYDAYQSDVYSLGVTMLYMALLEAPSHLYELATLKENTDLVIASLASLPTLQYYLAGMLKIKPSERPTFQQLTESIIYYLSTPQDITEDSTQDTFTQETGERCNVCKSIIRSALWHPSVQEQYEEYSQLMHLMCSRNCFINYVKGLQQNQDLCIFDCHPVQKEFCLQLDCYHLFCNRHCLNRHLQKLFQSEPREFTFQCPICCVQVPESFLVKTYGSRQVLLREVCPNLKSVRAMCQNCNIHGGDFPLQCNHLLCLDCVSSVKAPKDRIICAVCGKSQGRS